MTQRQECVAEESPRGRLPAEGSRALAARTCMARAAQPCPPAAAALADSLLDTQQNRAGPCSSHLHGVRDAVVLPVVLVLLHLGSRHAQQLGRCGSAYRGGRGAGTASEFTASEAKGR